MTEYCKGKPQDMEDIIDFANYVFSQSHEPHNFKTLLPKVYADNHNTAQNHYLVKENGKIKAMVMAYPSEIKVGNTLLKACGIGSVSVHPYSRGSGYMKKLMNMAVEDMTNDGCQLSILGGQRQRYEYFGYEPCGIQADFVVTKTNVRHAYKDIDCDNISFKLLTESDNELLDNAYNLHSSQIFTGVRSRQDFLDILHSWNANAYAVMCDNKFIGYIVRNGKSIGEIVIDNMDKLPSILKALTTNEKLDELYITASLAENQKIECLIKICEGYKLVCNHSFKIFDYKSVIKAFMELKASYTTMPDGEITIKIGEESILICVQNNSITVENTNKKADIEFSDLDAMIHIFSPAGMILNQNLPSYAKEWFPLPLYISSVDCC